MGWGSNTMKLFTPFYIVLVLWTFIYFAVILVWGGIVGPRPHRRLEYKVRLSSLLESPEGKRTDMMRLTSIRLVMPDSANEVELR